MTDPGPPDPPSPSFITFAMRRIKGVEGSGVRRLLVTRDHALLIRMCYLWPMTCCGVFLPVLVYARFRNDPELGPHARHGVFFATLYTLLMIVLGLAHGLLGRLADDWVPVSMVFSLITMALVATLTGFGWRWSLQALRGDEVEIPGVTALLTRL